MRSPVLIPLWIRLAAGGLAITAALPVAVAVQRLTPQCRSPRNDLRNADSRESGALGTPADARDKVPELAREDIGFVDTARGLGWSNRCYNHLQAGRFSNARAACNQGLAAPDLAPDNRGAILFNLGQVAEKTGDHAAARLFYRESLAVRPNGAGAATVQRALEALPSETSPSAPQTTNQRSATSAPRGTSECVSKIRASSHLPPNPPIAAFDGDETKAWCAMPPKGQWLEVEIKDGCDIAAIELAGGWAYDSPIALANSGMSDMWQIAGITTRMKIDWGNDSTIVEFDRATDRGVRKRVALPGSTRKVRITALAISKGVGANIVCLDGLALLTK